MMKRVSCEDHPEHPVILKNCCLCKLTTPGSDILHGRFFEEKVDFLQLLLAPEFLPCMVNLHRCKNSKTMVEVFKTNVRNPAQADLLIDRFHELSIAYIVNFDLEDVDKVLRVQSDNDPVNATLVIQLLEEFGFAAEVLPD
jgi:hypothetical protein